MASTHNFGIGTAAPTGTGAPARADSPTFTTQITTPKVLGGTGTTQTLTYQTTSGVGEAGARHIFLVGNNGATEAMTILNSGYVGIGTVGPRDKFEVNNGNILVDYVDGRLIQFRHLTSPEYRAGLSVDLTSRFINVDSFSGDSSGGIAFRTGAYTAPSEKMRITYGGNVGIGTTAPNQKLTVQGSISLVDQAAAAVDTAGYGQIWVSNATPDELWFTDDAGTDTQISSHPLDAPPELYINGPGIDWIGKRVQKYLGIIFWQKIDGTVIEETFDAYNLRRKDVPGHVDLVKRDWDSVQLAKLKTEKMKEIIEEEVASVDAFEDVEITEEVQTGIKAEGYAYTVDKDGKVIVTPKSIPIMTKQGTSKFEKQLKSDISFNADTGKFVRKHTLTEAEVNALALKAPEMPVWMKDWVAKS